MNSTCPICCEVLGTASATTECGHVFCTRCLLDGVAKNVGTEEGSTRNLCPLCRSNICDEVEPNKNLTIRLSDLEDQVGYLSDYLEDVIADAKASEATLHRAATLSERAIETFRSNFSRMETLMTTKDERIATLLLELDELRKGRRQSAVLKDYKPRTRSEVMIDAARQRHILNLVMHDFERVTHLLENHDDSDMDTAEDDDSDMDTTEDDWVVWHCEAESVTETIWINGDWHYIDTPIAQDWLVSRVI